jgi:hypothetical protein
MGRSSKPFGRRRLTETGLAFEQFLRASGASCVSDLVATPTTAIERESPRTGQRGRILLLPYRLTVGQLLRVLKRFERYFDDSEMSRSASGRRMRRGISLLFGAYAIVLEVTAVSHGDFATAPLFVAMLAIALFLGRGGTFVYYFLPVFLGLFSYLLAGQFAFSLSLPVHYTPQLRAEEWLTPGPIPTVWLQEHLYHGTTGVVEGFAVAMYLSHFAIPLVFGFGLAMTRHGRAFATLMFGLLAVSVLGEITFVLAPTAPPWLAEQAGYVTGVHHILKQSLYDLHFTSLANLIGDKESYDTTAAVPSLHAAFPLVCLLTAWRFGLPRWIRLALAVNVLGVSFAIVYTGDHYVVDALAGFVYAVAAFLIVGRLLRAGERESGAAESPATPRREPAVAGRSA